MKTFTINNKEIKNIYLNEVFNKWLDLTEFKGDINSLSKLFIIDCIKVLKEMDNFIIKEMLKDEDLSLLFPIKMSSISFEVKYGYLAIGNNKLIDLTVGHIYSLFTYLIILMESKL